MNIKKKQVNIRRLTLRGWAAIEDLQRIIKSSAEEGEWSSAPEFIFQTIELSLGKLDRKLFWMDVVEIYDRVLQLNQPTKKFPILSSKEKSKQMPWEYQGRSWYFWLNLFAKSYGWDEKQVGSLDIDDAIGLYQEIIIDEQLDREWDWGLSEVSYEYNKATKKSHFRPLPRPNWMKGFVGKPVKERKIPINAAPAGVIINLDEQGSDTVK